MTVPGTLRKLTEIIPSLNCSHCGLPVPVPRVIPEAETQFCCAGCEAVWQILHECHLDEYYRLRAELGDERPVPAKVSGKSFEYLDDPEYLRRFAEPRSQGAVRVELYLDGVHCLACSWLVERVLLEQAGVRYAQLNLGKSVVEIVFSPQDVTLNRIAQALDRIGYTPHPIIQDSASTHHRREVKRLLARMGIAGASAANIMLLAISQYAGNFTGIETGYSTLFRWISFGLALPAVTYSAWPFYERAWHGLRQKMLHMDLPIGLGILATFAISAAATIQHRGEVYYDSVSALIFLLLAGRLLLQRAGRWAANASESLISLAPKTAWLFSASGSREVLLSEVKVGDVLEVRAGDVVPVDGTLADSVRFIRESHLTGEPGTVVKYLGDLIYAGSTVEKTAILIKATAVGETTRLWGLARLMREAAVRRAPITLVMDRIAGYFVGAVLALAAITVWIWLVIDPSRALWNAAALMVMSCPCALGLATPIALAMAMGRAAKRGLFIRGQDGVERLAKVQHVIFDKTGTLTDGNMAVVVQIYAPELDAEEQVQVLRSAAALERRFGHAIAAAFQDMDASGLEAVDVMVTTGRGLAGQVNGSHYAAGSLEYISDFVTSIPESLLAAARDLKERGLTLVYVARDHHAVALFGLGDFVRPESRSLVGTIMRNGASIELLSGDHPDAVERVADQLGIAEFRGSVTPEEKLERVEALEAQGIHTAMIGDGVNDAAALSRATVGISVAGAAEVARDAADVFISTSHGPDAIAELFQLSRRALRRIRLTLAVAIVYNLIGAALAMTGHVNPLVAAVLMPLSSLTVLFIATRR